MRSGTPPGPVPCSPCSSAAFGTHAESRSCDDSGSPWNLSTGRCASPETERPSRRPERSAPRPTLAACSSTRRATRLIRLVDWRLEVVQVPVSDVDRAKAFYTEKAGFNADMDATVSDEIRFVQLTPPGSACSIALGTGLSDMRPGSVQGLQLVVSDINAARAELDERGVEVSEVQEFDWG